MPARRWPGLGAGLLIASLLLAAGYRDAPHPAADPSRVEAAFPAARITTVRPDGSRRDLTVALARTRAQLARGLAGRPRVAPWEGMLFLFPETGDHAMWMAGTRMPLDMLFLDDRGRIVLIAARRQPGDRTPVRAGRPVRAVLELPGGRAADLDLDPGGRIEKPGVFDTP